MSELRPFAALRFARDPEPRLAPPYDVVSEVDRERYAAEPENVVHLTLPPGPEGERDYAAAAATLARWVEAGVLVRDPAERLYVLHETLASGAIRRGVLGLLRLEDYASRVVLPHERTMAGPKRDRLQLTRATRTSLEPLFFLYEDRDGETTAILESTADERPLAACGGPDGTGLRLCALDAPGGVRSFTDFLSTRSLVIADGHHRYETMLAYRDECRARGESDPRASSEYVLAYLVNAFDPGTEIRAIHRVLYGDVAAPRPVFEKCGFELEPLGERSGDELIELLAARRAAEHAFVLVPQSGPPELAHRARGAPDELDVELLHRDLLPALGGELRFDSRPERLLATVRGGEATLGLLQNPLSAAELFAVVEQGRVLPQKSTFFAPKVPSGLVIPGGPPG